MATPNYNSQEIGARAWYPHAILPLIARDLVKSPEEAARKADANKRVKLFLDDKHSILQSLIDRVFDEQAVKARFLKFIRVAKSQSPFKRVVNLISRPVYATPPVRAVRPEKAQANFETIARECRLNDRLDLATRLANACNHVVLYPRYLPSLDRIEIDLLTPNMVSVLPNPESPLTALAIMYDYPVSRDGRTYCYTVYYDGAETFTLDENGMLVPGSRRDHGYRRMPFVWGHRTERFGKFWDTTSGDDLVSADEQCSLLVLLSMRLLKTQGFNQLVVSGDTSAIAKEQVLDEENALVAGMGVTISKLETKTDAAHYLAMLDATKRDAAANRGISAARLNEDVSSAAAVAEVGLTEERAEAVKMMLRVEEDLFDVLKMISVDRGLPIAEDATMTVDFPELEGRYDRKTELELADTERKSGLRNFLDDIKRKNPEIRDDGEAMIEFKRNLVINAEAYRLIRELNLSSDATAQDPGQSAEKNGAMGPKVRDGDMTKDEAADKAKDGGDE
jgi:hypothetical protein